MEHSSASPPRAVLSNSNNNNNNISRREKRKLESFVTESGDTWEFTRPVKKSRSSGPVGSNTSSTTAKGSPTHTQRPSFSATSTRGKRSRDPSDDADAQSPSPKRRMTSVNDLGDQAAVLRRARWLRSSRSRRQGAAASRSRSPEQSGLHGMFGAASGVSQSVGSVESEEELPDYESDEEVTVGQHAVNNLGEVAASQESAMIPPPAGHFQEGQESRETVVASIETDQAMESQVGSSHHSAFETVVSGEYAVAAGSGAYEAASTIRPVVWTSLDSRLASNSRSLSPVARYKLARAESSESESDVDRPQLLRSKFAGFARAPTTVQHRLEAQQQSAREPGHTGTSASGPGPVTAVDTTTSAATTKGFAPTLSPIKEASIEPVEAAKVQRALPTVPELHSTTSSVKQRSPAAKRSPAKRSPSKRASPTKRSPTKSASAKPSEVRKSVIMDGPSQQLISELEKYASDRRNWFAKQVQNEVDGEEVGRKDACARSTHPHNSQPQPDAFIPPALTSTPAHTEEESQQIMAVDAAKGPDEDDVNFFRICLGEIDGHMDVDGEEDLPVQNYSRDRIRKARDEDIRKAKLLNDSRRKVQNNRMLFDEAPEGLEDDSAVENESDQDNDEILYTDHLLASSDDNFHAEKLRLQAALGHWESSWPKPSTLPSEHWIQESITFANNQANATNSAEKHYWACRSIQAESYAEGKTNSGRGSNIHIAISLIDWKKSIAASEEEAASFAEQVSQIQLAEEDQEAPLRAKLALFLSDLPPELDQKVTEVLNITNPGRAIVKSPEGNDLTRKDFATLLHSANYRTGEPEGWLNDEIINGFFTALCNGMNNKAGHTKGKVPPYASYITGWYSSVTKNGIKAIERWSRRKGIKGDKLLQCKRIFFPVNPGNHWSLLVICPDTHTIEYLDSLDVGYSDTNRKSGRYIKLARQWLEMELGKRYVADEWKEVDRRSAIQNNGSDCGVFTCLNGFASALELSNPTNEFGPEQIPFARRAMVSLFNLGGFNKHFEL